ncbi:MAG TPA: hypothetical protein VFV24_05120, partial [Candidatus Eisenbacteria bacterium]|nr:hypothetical protein [Candidatus Eisenbacteria bacterium]
DLLLYFADPEGTAPFLRIGPGLRWISFDTSATDANETATQFSLGGGFGVRVPAGDRLAMRLQASAERNFESDEFRASWDAGVMFGLSFFTATSPGDPRAQGSGSVEIGLDARVSKTLTSDEFQGVNDPRDDPFIAQLPFAMFRVGPYLTDRIQLEPSVGFSQISVEGEGYHDLNLGLDLLLYLADPGESAPFIRIGPGLHWVNLGTADFIPGFDDTATQVSLGGGFGVRVPAGDRLAMRLQAIGERNFESDEFRASWDVGAMFGLSFFTK